MTTRPLRVLHLCHADAESGAGRAAYRLHAGLRSVGVDSRMLVGFRRSGDSSVYSWGSYTWNLLRSHLDQLPNGFAWPASRGRWSNGLWPRRRYEFADGWRPDLLNMHWLGAGFGNLPAIRSWGAPEVWTLHDMRAFTGGCHYSGECTRYSDQCGRCPVLESKLSYDLSSINQRAQRRHFEKRPIAVVAPSRWMAQNAARSQVMSGVRLEQIPYGLDLQAFRPHDRATARQLLGLPADAKLIGFGAMLATSDRRKGFDLMESALKILCGKPGFDNCHLVVFGGHRSERAKVAGFEATFLGFLKDDMSLSLAYSAVDVLVVPSREDNLPQAPIEALACGTPSVAFAIGGMPDIIAHKESGWLARGYEVAELAEGISWILQGGHDVTRASLRALAENRYALALQAQGYQTLYTELCQDQPGGRG